MAGICFFTQSGDYPEGPVVEGEKGGGLPIGQAVISSYAEAGTDLRAVRENGKGMIAHS